MEFYTEPEKKIPVKECDVVVAGAGTGGVVAALAAARNGARTVLIESKGYPGGLITEGGTALHSFYNIWGSCPGAEKRQIVKGIPAEIVERLVARGACTGYAEQEVRADYDSVCTAIDTEIYKVNALEMLQEAGVDIQLNTFLTGAVTEGDRVQGVITESRSGREAVMASSFVDCTGYGDVCGHAGAEFTEPNDHPVANSIGMGGVSLEGYYEFLKGHDAVSELCYGPRSGQEGKIIRISGNQWKLPEAFGQTVKEIGMHMVTTTTHDDYYMFIKLNYKMPVSPTSRDEVTKAEIELRQRQVKAVELIRKFVPGCQKAFIARSSPSVCIRRGRLIACDYDLTHEDIIDARHFGDDIMAYAFHDLAPKYVVRDGSSYGVPYRALCVKGIDNLYATGMMITSDFRAHMSTRNTVCCMGQGQGAGTAAALCAAKKCGSRELAYADLKAALVQDGVYFE